MCALLWAWGYFRLPEPRGRTYGEMDVLFQAGVPARKFAKADVEEYAAAVHGGAAVAVDVEAVDGQEPQQKNTSNDNAKVRRMV